MKCNDEPCQKPQNFPPLDRFSGTRTPPPTLGLEYFDRHVARELRHAIRATCWAALAILPNFIEPDNCICGTNPYGLTLTWLHSMTSDPEGTLNLKRR